MLAIVLEFATENKFFNGGELLPLKVRAFRPDLWLLEDLNKYAKERGLLVPEDQTYNFSKALHGFVREQKEKLLLANKLQTDCSIYKTYVEKLTKDLKPFNCIPIGGTVTLLECYQCQQRTKETSSNAPQAVKDCPRNRS